MLKLTLPPRPRPEPRPASAELRNMMFVSWGEQLRAGKLADVERAANLHGIVRDPYQELAFAELSRTDKMLICAHRLMENKDWAAAYRVLAGVERIELARQRLAQTRSDTPPEPTAQARPEPEPATDSDPDPGRDCGPDSGPDSGPIVLGRRWSVAEIEQLVEQHPGLADMTPAQTIRILAEFTPAPDT